jgi:DNA polymerase-3 subunit delta
MNINGHQLKSYLNSQPRLLTILYGTEPYLLQEYASQLLAYYNCDEVRKIFIESNSDWDLLIEEVMSPALFAPKQVFDVRYSKETFDAKAKKTLELLLTTEPNDVYCLVRAANLKKAQTQTSWLKAHDAKILSIQAWPLKGNAKINWIKQKMQSHGLSTSLKGMQLVDEATQGNMLALSQTIDKLELIFEQGHISENELVEVLSIQSSYDVFQFAEACLSQQDKKAQIIMHQLRAQAVEPALLLWALSKEIRLLIKLCFDLEQGLSFNQAFSNAKLWESKKLFYQSAIKANAKLEFYCDLLKQCKLTDESLKGINSINAWLLLSKLSLSLSSAKKHISE